jgi:hypothetical protein
MRPCPLSGPARPDYMTDYSQQELNVRLYSLPPGEARSYRDRVQR